MSKRIVPLVFTLALAACGSTAAARAPVTASAPSTSAASAPSSSEPPRCPETVGPLPAPTGEHHVGVAPLPSAAPLGHLVAFYPTADCGADHPPYLRSELADALGLDQAALSSVVVHASAGAAPLGGAPRPVVVLAPGWTSLAALSTSLASDLASHGYVVVTCDPPLGSEATTYPDASATSQRMQALSGVLDLLDDPVIAAITGPIDRTHVAAGGHSFAGSIAFRLAQDDRRLSAVFDLDGVLHGSALESPMRVPALIVATSGGSAADQSLATVLAQSPNAIGVVVDRADHYDLTDVPALVPVLGPLTASLAHGPIGPHAINVTNRLVRGFLDCITREATTTGQPCTPTAEALTRGLADAAPLHHLPTT